MSDYEAPKLTIAERVMRLGIGFGSIYGYTFGEKHGYSSSRVL